MAFDTASFDDDQVRETLKARLRLLLVVLLVLAVTGSAAVAYAARDILQLRSQPTVDLMSSPLRRPEAIPPFRSTDNPLAVLVLDVSGSMERNDPDARTLRAVETFLNVFSHMARGASSNASAPHVAVVLYSSAASAVAFGGELWLDLEQAGRVEDVLERLAPFLLSRNVDDDPRVGWHTDHRGAAIAAGQIVDRYRATRGAGAAACVVFLTDGLFDPSPLLDAGLSSEDLQQNAELFWAAVADEAWPGVTQEALEAARRQFEEARGRDLPAVGGASSDGGREVFPVTALWRTVSRRGWAPEGWYERVTSGLTTSAAPDPEELRSVASVGPDGVYREVVLAADDTAIARGGFERNALVVRDPRELELSFADVLAEWLELQEQPVADAGFSVKPGARSLAVLATLPTGPASGVLRGPRQAHELTNGLGLIDEPDPGEWHLELGGGGGVARVYADERYKWGLKGMPLSFSIFDDEAQIEIALFSRESQDIESLETLYSRWAPTAEAKLTLADGTVRRISAPLVEEEWSYRFALPNSGVPGPVTIEARVGQLAFRDGRSAEGGIAHGTTFYREAIRVRLAHRGRDGRLHPIGAVDRMTLPRGSEVAPSTGAGSR